MSMPAIRAIGLPLPLLVLGVGADDHRGAGAAVDLAVVAACLDRGSDFQRFLVIDCATASGAGSFNVLLQPVGDAAARQAAGARGWGAVSFTVRLLRVGDAAARQVVGRKLDSNTVARQDPDEIHPKLPG